MWPCLDAFHLFSVVVFVLILAIPLHSYDPIKCFKYFIEIKFYTMVQTFKIQTLCSSFGMIKPHPCSQGNGLLGLYSHSDRCESSESSLTTL